MKAIKILSNFFKKRSKLDWKLESARWFYLLDRLFYPVFLHFLDFLIFRDHLGWPGWPSRPNLRVGGTSFLRPKKMEAMRVEWLDLDHGRRWRVASPNLETSWLNLIETCLGNLLPFFVSKFQERLSGAIKKLGASTCWIHTCIRTDMKSNLCEIHGRWLFLQFLQRHK